MLHGFIEKLSRLSAYIGGAVLCFLVILTCVSVTGRLLNGILHGSFMQNILPEFSAMLIEIGVGPVRGDYEFTEAGMAFAIFAFLPICQLHAAHASVDVFANLMPRRLSGFITWLAEVVFAIALVILAWQLANGLTDKYTGNETTFHLEFPVWLAYAASMWGASVAALVGVYVAVLRSREYFFGIAMPVSESHGDAI